MTEQLLAELRSLRAFVQMATAECVRANERAAPRAPRAIVLRFFTENTLADADVA